MITTPASLGRRVAIGYRADGWTVVVTEDVLEAPGYGGTTNVFEVRGEQLREHDAEAWRHERRDGTGRRALDFRLMVVGRIEALDEMVHRHGWTERSVHLLKALLAALDFGAVREHVFVEDGQMALADERYAGRLTVTSGGEEVHLHLDDEHEVGGSLSYLPETARRLGARIIMAAEAAERNRR